MKIYASVYHLSGLFFLCLIGLQNVRAQTHHAIRRGIEDSVQIARKISVEDAFVLLDRLCERSIRHFGEKDSTTAKVIYRKGATFHRKKAYPDALTLYHKALDIREQIGIPESHPDLSINYHGLGAVYEMAEHYDSAIEFFTEAIRLRKANHDPKLWRSSYLLARSYSYSGDFKMAEYYYKQALYHVGNREYQQATLLYNIAVLAQQQLDPDTALVRLDAAMKIYASLEDTEEDVARCDNLQAIVYDDLKDYEKAITHYIRAINYFEKAEDFHTLGILYNNTSISYKKLNLIDRALVYSAKAISTNKKNYEQEYHNSYVVIYDNLGDIYLHQKDYLEALDAYHLATQNIISQLRNKGPYHIPDLANVDIYGSRLELLIVLESKARIFRLLYQKAGDQKDLNAALQTYRQASQLIDLIRQEQTEEASQLHWRQQTRPVYEQAVETAFLAGDHETAFSFCEKSKAALLLDAIKNEEAQQFVPDTVLHKEKQLQQQLSDLELERLTTASPDSLLQIILNKKETLNELVKQLEKDYPKYYQYKYSTTVVNIADVQANLINDTTALVEYFLTDTLLYAFVITKEKFQVKRFLFDADITENTRTIIRLLADKEAISSATGFRKYLQAAHQLHQQLIAPLDLAAKRLIIVPDGILNYIPFECLVKNKKEENPSYLIYDFTVNYSYSSTILAHNKTRQRNSNGKVLALAPVNFSALNPPLAPLALSDQEIKSVLELFRGKKLTRDKATLISPEIFEQKAKAYSVLHISSHASADDSNNKIPWIAFYDTLLFLPQLYHLNLNAEMVVLSACETSKGNFQTGEGVMSIARGFAYAGVPGTVTTLWEVNDGATAKIMTAFYQYLQKSYPKDQALRQARLDYLQHNINPEPYYWAGIIHVGNPRPVNLQMPSVLYSVYALFPVLILLIIVYFAFRT